MALIEWKQISGDLRSSGNLTGSLYLSGSQTITGSLNLFGDQNIDGDVNIDGTITAREFKTELVSASIIFESGSSLFGNSDDDTHVFTGSIFLTGSQVISGSLFTRGGVVSFEDYPWPVAGQETHILKTQPFDLVFNGVTRSYDYMGIALEHYEANLDYYHNSLLLYTYDNHDTPSYGAELNIGPIRSHLRQYASGSDNLGNLSFRELLDGRVQGLFYANEIQIGQYAGENIGIGNPSASISATGSFRLELNGIDQYFSVDINGSSQVKVNEEGVLQVAVKDVTPTAVTGGLFYSSSNEYYLGFNS